jgi:hypothetical protein
MYWLTHSPTLVRLAPHWSIMTNPFGHVGFRPLVPCLLQSHHGSNLPSVTQLAYICKCLMYWLTPWPTVVCLAPRISIINNPSGQAGSLPLLPCLLHSHHGSNHSISHAYSLGLRVFDVLAYSLFNCGSTCSSLISYQPSIMSCWIPASCTISPTIPRKLHL